MKTKTVNVVVTIQMDVNSERSLADVVTGLDSINGLLQRNQDETFNAQIFVSGVDNSDITDVDTDEDLQLHDRVVVPDPDDSDLHNHSFVGTIVHIYESGDMMMVEDGDGNCWDIETDRLTREDE